MNVDYYFVGSNLLVVTVEHDTLDRMSHVYSEANRRAVRAVRERGGFLEPQLRISNEETKTAEDGNALTVLTYEVQDAAIRYPQEAANAHKARSFLSRLSHRRHADDESGSTQQTLAS